MGYNVNDISYEIYDAAAVIGVVEVRKDVDEAETE